MSTITTRSGKGSPLTNNEVDSNFTNLNTDKAELSGATFTGEIVANAGIALGDNDKATFGASDDLQIYHDGSDSYIRDSGTGDLRLRGTQLKLEASSGERFLEGVENGLVRIYYDNAVKLATTSTGIDVTGTATMDLLTVASGSTGVLTTYTGSSSARPLSVSNYDGGFSGSAYSINAESSGGEIALQTASKDRIKVGSGGDISFYEDTGTTPKLFWDASAGQLQLSGTDGPQLRMYANGGSGSYWDMYSIYSGTNPDLIISNSVAGNVLTATSTGRVGIGTSSPNHNLSVNSSSTGIISVGDFTGDNVKTYIEADQTNNVAKINSRNNHPLAFSVHNTERMRIDLSGNLLVGTTDSSPWGNSAANADDNGVVATSSGIISSARYNNTPALFNRTGNDGTVISVRKQGQEIGSIGTRLNRMYIGTGDTGVLFDSTNDAITPENTSTPASRDAAIDLGRSTTRFKDLYLSGTVNTEAVSTNSLDLQAIAESKSVTARDVFVYDTSKDSDGGAWRNRTQGTSWYNEALNTSTRGATKKFPAVAVIVAEAYKVTIYDGDDPAMPMWMVFNGGTNTGYSFAGFSPSNRAHSSIVMLNGVMTTGGSGAGYLTTCSFLDEKGVVYLSGGNGVHVLRANIVDRNDTFIYTTNLGNANVLVNGYVNDVAMTVLPNAPIDADTGLPVPTIAVATNGGVSVIKDDGTVVDINGYNAAWTRIEWLEGDNFGAVRAGTGLYTFKLSNITDGVNENSVLTSRYKSNFDSYGVPVLYNSSSVMFPTNTSGNITVGNVSGVSVVNPNLTTPSESSVAYIASDYNTGWMNGDIKLATLSDTDDTDANPSELVINGDFSNGTSGWTAQLGAVLSVSNGQLSVQSVGANSLAYRYFTADLNESYILTVTVISGVGVLQTQGYGTGTLSAGTYTLVMPAGRGNNKLDITPSINTTFVVGNVSIKRAEQDRSVNGKGLQVVGTVTKTAVATGADLVAYSGFSSSNYLQQPYNSDLDFGTGDFCVMGWYKFNYDTGNLTYVLERGAGKLEMFAFSGSGIMRLYLAGAVLESNASLFTGSWHQICCVRRNGVAFFYLNGKLKTTQTSTGNVDTTTAPLSVGARNNGTYPSAGSSLALWRISATAPTAEQIAKMYRDEKLLFQENVKATLYGTSDAVTALAYDDDTELLHAGTSAGRSVFKGLQRVSNTTDAVGVAISASNDLVVEE